jgi:hypothetical protein
MSVPSIPQTYWMNVNSSNGMTMGGGIKMTVDPVTMKADKPIATLMTGDPKKPLATTVDMLNIPHLTLGDIKDIMTPKLRVHMPNYEQVSFKLFGMEVFSVCMSGEMQMITQPFVPNAYETCKIECPDEEQRPFPKSQVFNRDEAVKMTDEVVKKAMASAGEGA